MSAPARVSVERAAAWVDAATRPLGSEKIALAGAADRVLAADVSSPRAIPSADCAAIDGYAVRAAHSLGAGPYNPIAVPGGRIEWGEVLPSGTDAVVAIDHTDMEADGRVLLVEPVAAGVNVARAGTAAAAGALLIAEGTRLASRHIGMLALAGRDRVPVVRRPRVRLVIAGRARAGSPVDVNRAMLQALIERDGGETTSAGLVEAFGPGADIVLVAGGTGRGGEDGAAVALSAAGRVEIHGVALSPGDTAGFGYAASGLPVLLLPGAPAACLWNYELFAGRAIRRLAGRHGALPYASRSAVSARKIVSAIGVTEICPIRRLPGGEIEPLASFAEAGLRVAIDATGFVIVPEASEGYPAGADLIAYLFDEHDTLAERRP